jgi:hypothetical protein
LLFVALLFGVVDGNVRYDMWDSGLAVGAGDGDISVDAGEERRSSGLRPFSLLYVTLLYCFVRRLL